MADKLTSSAFSVIGPAGKDGADILGPFSFSEASAVVDFLADLYSVPQDRMAALMLAKGMRVVPVTITEV